MQGRYQTVQLATRRECLCGTSKTRLVNLELTTNGRVGANAVKKRSVPLRVFECKA